MFITWSPVVWAVDWSVLEEVLNRDGTFVVRCPCEEDEVDRLHPRFVVGAVRSVVSCQCCGDLVFSSVGGRWEDGTAGVGHFVLERSLSPGSELIL